jgi:hypothetical protein
VDKVFAGGIVVLVVSYVARLTLMPTAAWTSLATWLTGFV